MQRLRGAAARTVINMESSLEVPTATSVRAIPAKLLIDNRIVINNHLARARGGKVSFTHFVGFALVQALAEMPEMNHAYAEDADGKPALARPAHINLGIAIDLAKDDGTRQLLVPNIKHCEQMDFAQFWAAYEDVVRRARTNKLRADDFDGTTISLTNPGTIGTVHSVPRLMRGQGTIIGVGAMEYPAEYQGASEETLARLAVSKTMTLTSTYDHRIIQGAQSGDFLRIVHRKLLGEDGFYDRIFHALRLPYAPIRWVRDISVAHDDEINKTSRVQELIHAYRVRGHLMADTDPLEYQPAPAPRPRRQTHGLTLWDLDREFPTGGFGGKPRDEAPPHPRRPARLVLPTIGIEYMHIQDPELLLAVRLGVGVSTRSWIQVRCSGSWMCMYSMPDRPAIRVAQHAEDVAQQSHRLAAEAAGRELAVEVPQRQAVGARRRGRGGVAACTPAGRCRPSGGRAPGRRGSAPARGPACRPRPRARRDVLRPSGSARTAGAARGRCRRRTVLAEQLPCTRAGTRRSAPWMTRWSYVEVSVIVLPMASSRGSRSALELGRVLEGAGADDACPGPSSAGAPSERCRYRPDWSARSSRP